MTAPSVRLSKLPEATRQAEPPEDRLVLLSSVRLPVRSQPVAVPGVRELADLSDRDRGTWLSFSQPGPEVLFRPEEIHRASREDDVVPPAFCGHQAVEGVVVADGALVLYVDDDRLSAIRAGSLDSAVDM